MNTAELASMIADSAARWKNTVIHVSEWADLLMELRSYRYFAPTEGYAGTCAIVMGRPVLMGGEMVVIWEACEYCREKAVPKDGHCVKCGAPVDGLDA